MENIINNKTLKCQSFPEYLLLIKNSNNKIGVLINGFKIWHTNAPEEDLENCEGRIAKLYSLAHKDYGYLLQIIYMSAANNPNGSHLNYIQKIIERKNTTQNNQKPVIIPKLKTSREVLDKYDR